MQPGKGPATGIRQLDGLHSGSISITGGRGAYLRGHGGATDKFPPRLPLDSGELRLVRTRFAEVRRRIDKNCQLTNITGAFNGITVRDCRPLILNTVVERNDIGVNCLRGGSAENVPLHPGR